MSVVVELCVQGIESARAGEAGGADRIELCENLDVGGVTPSAGTIAVACRRLAIPIQILIRPRGGDFHYSDAEFAVMEHDIEVARSLGAAGVVLGVLQADGSVDRERTARLIAIARPLSVTFHRAFDAVPDPFAALDDLIALGVDRVLTSGGRDRAVIGIGRLADLHARAERRIILMAGGRIVRDDIPTILGSGLREIHIGSAACREGRTDPGLVHRLVAAARARGGSAGGFHGPDHPD